MHTVLDEPSGGVADETHSDGGGDDLSDFDSLFDEPMGQNVHETTVWKQDPARRSPPRPGSPNFVPGLYFHWPTITVPPDLERQVVVGCLTSWFLNPPRDHDSQLDLDSFLEASSFNDVNQVMLFNRADGVHQPTPPTLSTAPVWLPCLTSLLAYVSEALAPPVLDISTWDILFSPEPSNDPGDAPDVPGGTEQSGKRSRQAIINLYHPGEGISDHIDLLGRYDDGIVGVSLISGCVMRFGKPDHGHHRDPLSHQDHQYTNLYLPPRSVVALVGDARYKWTHGIPSRRLDLVQEQSRHDPERSTWLDRQLRLSVTFRWLLPGADTVGSTDSPSIPSN
ncbi:hypothetical protein BJ322DRAFT_305973 [Thelephora terrestris]|uniref:Fe2OG dioxygenase domain-containing protein n=1 Tax=Thelephora terrestris TaxID=56493 RepID=A0A9P6L323_9AGAM|nr:hypothetical protein BJ322DRAFT_305973 [Thelephora terrestris]